MIAWPVRYGQTGVMSFMINQDDRVYQSNLGVATAEHAQAINRFNLIGSWHEVM